MRRQLVVMVVVCLLGAPSLASALGLGKIQVKSSLYKPFDAVIPLLSVKPDEVDSLKVKLASYEAFEKAGLVKNSFLREMKVVVVEGDNGKPVVKLTTQRVAKEPVIDLLLVLESKSGKVVRAFTVLLDSQ